MLIVEKPYTGIMFELGYTCGSERQRRKTPNRRGPTRLRSVNLRVISQQGCVLRVVVVGCCYYVRTHRAAGSLGNYSDPAASRRRASVQAVKHRMASRLGTVICVVARNERGTCQR